MKKILSILLMISLLLTPVISNADIIFNPLLPPSAQQSIGHWQQLDECTALLIPYAMELTEEFHEDGVSAKHYSMDDVVLAYASVREGAIIDGKPRTLTNMCEDLAAEGAFPIPLTEKLYDLDLHSPALYQMEDDYKSVIFLMFNSPISENETFHVIGAVVERESGYDALEMVSQLRFF